MDLSQEIWFLRLTTTIPRMWHSKCRCSLKVFVVISLKTHQGSNRMMSSHKWNLTRAWIKIRKKNTSRMTNLHTFWKRLRFKTNSSHLMCTQKNLRVHQGTVMTWFCWHLVMACLSFTLTWSMKCHLVQSRRFLHREKSLLIRTVVVNTQGNPWAG